MSRGGSREPIDLDELHTSLRDAPAEPAPEPPGGRGAGRGQIVPRAHRRRRPGRALLILLLVLAVPVAVAGVGTAWFQHRLNGSPGGKSVTITIAAHSSTNAIGNLLEHKGVIDSTVAFRLYTRVFHHSKLHAGTFTLHEHMGVRDAVTALEHTVAVQRLVLEIRPGLWL
ncbi:MAG TPA: endolytic transglycosylase MltG, partial [Acidimicrobiia bacterium]